MSLTFLLKREWIEVMTSESESEIALYQTEDRRTQVDVRLENEMVYTLTPAESKLMEGAAK